MRTTDTPTPADGTRALIAEGLAAGGLLPPYDRVQELDRLLRAEIDRLLPIVQASTDRLPRYSTAWDTRERMLRRTRRVLDDDLGSGLRSAALHVHALAQHCAWLTEWAEES